MFDGQAATSTEFEKAVKVTQLLSREGNMASVGPVRSFTLEPSKHGHGWDRNNSVANLIEYVVFLL